MQEGSKCQPQPQEETTSHPWKEWRTSTTSRRGRTQPQKTQPQEGRPNTAPKRKGQPPTRRSTPTPLRRTEGQANYHAKKVGRTVTARRGNHHDKKDGQGQNPKPEKASPTPTPRRKGHAPTWERRPNPHPDKAGPTPTSRRKGQASTIRRKGQPQPPEGQPPTPRRNAEPTKRKKDHFSPGEGKAHPNHKKDGPNTAPRRKFFF